MEYQRKHQQLILRLNRGEELLSAVRAVCKEEKILSASVMGLGAADYVKLGVYSVARKEYIVRELSGEREIAALTGNVTAKDGAPYLHFHIAVCGKDGVVYGGHLNEAVISATAELYFTLYEILPERVREEETGLNLLSFPKQRRF